MMWVRSSQVALLPLLVTAVAGWFTSASGGLAGYRSAVGDPGMKRNDLRVAFEGWNFCNEVGAEAPGMGSPRAADCFDLRETTTLMPEEIMDIIDS